MDDGVSGVLAAILGLSLAILVILAGLVWAAVEGLFKR